MDLNGLKLVLNDGEQLLWSGRPSKKAFKAGLILSSLFITGAMLLALLVTSSQTNHCLKMVSMTLYFCR